MVGPSTAASLLGTNMVLWQLHASATQEQVPMLVSLWDNHGTWPELVQLLMLFSKGSKHGHRMATTETTNLCFPVVAMHLPQYPITAPPPNPIKNPSQDAPQVMRYGSWQGTLPDSSLPYGLRMSTEASWWWEKFKEVS